MSAKGRYRSRVAMESSLKTTVTDLPESRVRIEAEVPAEDVARGLDKTARDLARNMKLPGFRKGKVPTPVVIKRIGRDAVFEEMLRDELSRWYGDVITNTGIEPVGDPKLDVGALPDEDGPLKFSIEVGVRPQAKLGKYKKLEVGRAEAEVTDEALEKELEALREQHARLEHVDEPAGEHDFVMIDYVGTLGGAAFEGGEGRDQAIELGSGRLVEGFEEQLKGAKADEQRTVTITFPEDYQAEKLAGKEAEFAVTVKEVKRKQLPKLDDDFAGDAAGLDTLAELCDEIRTKLLEAQESSIENEFRERAVDATAAEAKIDLPDSLVRARATEVWEHTAHSLSHRGISKETYLKLAEKTEEEMIAEACEESARDLAREAVLIAVVEAEQIEPSEQDLLEALAPAAEREGVDAQDFLSRLQQSGRLSSLRRDVAMRKAIDVIVESAKPIPLERTEAREKIGTPGSE